jgi:copper transport protein
VRQTAAVPALPSPGGGGTVRRHRRAGLAALLALGLLLMTVGGASAHANLERSTPNANAVVVEQPKQLFLFFSEEPEVRLTEVQLLDPTGKEIATLRPRPAPGDPRAVTANLPDLSPGTFVVSWRTTSAVDGHTTRGGFPFTYGAGQVPVSVSAPGLEGAAQYTPSATSVVARFLTFTGAIGLAGALAFGPLVLWPALAALPVGGRRRGDRAGAAETTLRAAGRALVLVGLYAVPALIVGTALAALGQASESADLPLLAAFGEPLQRAVVGTRYGYVFGARIAATLVLAALIPYLARRGQARAPRLAAPVPAAGLLLTLSLGSHAAAAPILTPLVVAVDLVHLGAASVWLGGLIQLCLIASLTVGTPGVLGALVGRFSVAVWAVGTVVATGLIQAAIGVGSPAPLVETPYGLTLIGKSLLVAAMAGLGFYHWRRLGPALGQRAGAALEELSRRFRATAWAEALLGVMVLVATGLLTAEQPARDAAVALRHVTARGTADDLTLTLTVAPGEAGLNRTELTIGSPSPLQGVEKVVLRLSHLEMDMGEQEVELQKVREGVYQLQGGQFSMAGPWRVEPLVRRAGRDDARVALTAPIGEPLGSNVDDSQGFELTPRMILGIEAGIFGLILLVAAGQLRRRSSRASWSALVGGFGAIVIGGYVTASAVAAEQTAPSRLKNPIPMDQVALGRGRMLYQQNCLSCHGVAGRGDGPVGRSLNPRPADLRAHVTQHPDGQLFDWVTNGVPGSAMPAFRDTISAEDRWRLIGFIKGFAEDGPAPAQTAAAELRRTAPGGPGGSPSKEP